MRRLGRSIEKLFGSDIIRVSPESIEAIRKGRLRSEMKKQSVKDAEVASACVLVAHLLEEMGIVPTRLIVQRASLRLGFDRLSAEDFQKLCILIGKQRRTTRAALTSESEPTKESSIITP